MRNSDQPQNTKQNLVRDASVQIGGEEEKPKGELIRLGLRAFLKKKEPALSNERLDNQGYGMLSALCGMLTDPNRHQREYAKKEIRLMVKLGKEAGNE